MEMKLHIDDGEDSEHGSSIVLLGSEDNDGAGENASLQNDVTIDASLGDLRLDISESHIQVEWAMKEQMIVKWVTEKEEALENGNLPAPSAAGEEALTLNSDRTMEGGDGEAYAGASSKPFVDDNMMDEERPLSVMPSTAPPIITYDHEKAKASEECRRRSKSPSEPFIALGDFVALRRFHYLVCLMIGALLASMVFVSIIAFIYSPRSEKEVNNSMVIQSLKSEVAGLLDQIKWMFAEINGCQSQRRNLEKELEKHRNHLWELSDAQEKNNGVLPHTSTVSIPAALLALTALVTLSSAAYAVWRLSLRACHSVRRVLRWAIAALFVFTAIQAFTVCKKEQSAMAFLAALGVVTELAFSIATSKSSTARLVIGGTAGLCLGLRLRQKGAIIDSAATAHAHQLVLLFAVTAVGVGLTPLKSNCNLFARMLIAGAIMANVGVWLSLAAATQQ